MTVARRGTAKNKARKTALPKKRRRAAKRRGRVRVREKTPYIPYTLEPHLEL